MRRRLSNGAAWCVDSSFGGSLLFSPCNASCRLKIWKANNSSSSLTRGIARIEEYSRRKLSSELGMPVLAVDDVPWVFNNLWMFSIRQTSPFYHLLIALLIVRTLSLHSTNLPISFLYWLIARSYLERVKIIRKPSDRSYRRRRCKSVRIFTSRNHREVT